MVDGSALTEPQGASSKFLMASPNDSTERLKPHVYLFDEFWREGELALLFGESGKTTLAVQIAEAISRGKPLSGEKMTAAAQTVLYLDLQMTADQFRARYIAESTDETGVLSQSEHSFSDNFKRVEMPEGVFVNGPESARELGESLEWLVKTTGSRVMIIDSITSFRGSGGGTTGELMILRELNRLKRKYGLSILVVLNREVRPGKNGLTVRDLGPSAILANFVDSVFALGHSGSRGPYRYIKQLRSCGGELTYDADHTPTFRMARDDRPFKFFEFLNYADEKRQLTACGDGIDYQNLVYAFLLRDDGVSIRDIADDLGLSKSKVHRLLQMERPPMPPDEPEPSDEDPDGSDTADAEMPGDDERHEPEFSDPPVPETEPATDEGSDEQSNEFPEPDSASL